MLHQRLTVLALAATALAASGCAPPPEQNAAELAGLKQSGKCESSLPFFGQYRFPGERLFTYAEPHGDIRMNNDGGWCWIVYTLTYDFNPTWSNLALHTPPAHGSAVLGTLGGKLRMAYQPAPGFTGSDDFEVEVERPVRYIVPVHVEVSK